MDICVGLYFNFHENLEIWKYLPSTPIHHTILSNKNRFTNPDYSVVNREGVKYE